MQLINQTGKNYTPINTSLFTITDFIHQILSASSLEELYSVIHAIRSHYGYDFYALYAKVPRAGKGLLTFLFREYENDWTKHYESNQYMFCDPSIRLSAKSVCPFIWTSHLFDEITPVLKSNEFKISYDAYDFGLKEVFNAPFRSANGSFGLIRFINNNKGQSTATTPNINIKNVPEHYYLASYIYERLISLLSKNETSNLLSNREKDVLTWTSQGKSPSNISDLLNISENTVRKHLSNIRFKMGVKNITHAVAKAITENIIHP